MKIGRKINANSQKIIEYANGKVLGKVIDLMITFSYLVLNSYDIRDRCFISSTI